jgi:hypothetical protein
LGFLNGLLLFGLTGALVPLIIHLLERRRVPRLEFPSLRFLRELNQRQMRRLNLRRLLLLILRMLIVATIAFALARPTLLGPLASLFPEDTPRSIALLIDSSASMALETEQGTLRELALARSRELIANLSAKDEVLLYAVEEQPFDVGGGTLSPTVAENLLSNWRWGEGGTALRAALLKAQRALRRQPRYQKEIYIISDFAAATMDTVGLLGAEDVRCFAIVLPGGPSPNAGLTDLRLPATPILPGSPFNLMVVAELQAGGAIEPFPVELELAGKHRGSLLLAPEAGSPDQREMSVSVEEEGMIEGMWRKKRDRFPLDDVLPFTLPVSARLSVLLLEPSPPSEPANPEAASLLSLAGHLSRALDPFRGTQAEELSLRLEQVTFQRLSSANLEGKHLVVLAGGEGLDETQAELLSDFAAGGGGLIICPSEQGLASLARHLLPRVEGPRSLEPVDGGADYLSELDPEHPLFDDFTEEHRQVLADQPLWNVFRTRPGNRAILARLASGKPAMLGWDHGQGRLRLLLFEAGPEGGELPYSSMFLPLIQEMVQEAAGAFEPQWREVGSSLSWPLFAEAGMQERLQVLAPDGRLLPVRVDTGSFPPRAVLDRADRGGFYRLQRQDPMGSVDLGLAAVRVPAVEGKLAPLPVDSLAAALDWPGLVVVGAEEMLSAALHEGRFGKEIAGPLLFLAALLMALELWVAQRESLSG